MAIPGPHTGKLKLLLAVLLVSWLRWVQITANSIIYHDPADSLIYSSDILAVMLIFGFGTAGVSHLVDISYLP
jgi:hypothetical protein